MVHLKFSQKVPVRRTGYMGAYRPHYTHSGWRESFPNPDINITRQVQSSREDENHPAHQTSRSLLSFLFVAIPSRSPARGWQRTQKVLFITTDNRCQQSSRGRSSCTPKYHLVQFLVDVRRE